MGSLQLPEPEHEARLVLTGLSSPSAPGTASPTRLQQALLSPRAQQQPLLPAGSAHQVGLGPVGLGHADGDAFTASINGLLKSAGSAPASARGQERPGRSVNTAALQSILSSLKRSAA